MTGDHHINRDSVLHEYEYEQDSDLDDEGEDDSDVIGLRRNPVPGNFQTGTPSGLHTPGKFRPLSSRCSGLMDGATSGLDTRRHL
jgi:hypothetical protein